MSVLETTEGYEFRDLMDKWEDARLKEDKHNNINMLVDGQNFILFFAYKDKVYGTTEQHRVTFSKMLAPDEDTSEAWLDDAKFMAFNLTDAIIGKPAQEIFYTNDVDDICIVDKENVLEQLRSVADMVSAQQVSAGARTIAKFVRQYGGPKEPVNPPGSTGIPIRGKE